MPLNPSEMLNNRYRIIKLLGQGGFGAVYRAWDMNLQKACAVKENLDISTELSAQFMREATTLANLAHSNLPRVIDHFSLPERGQYLVMDFVEGENLEAKVIKGGPVPYPQAVFWIGQIADALDYLHNQPQPLIHRDIKPANIIITPNGQAMLVDFGLVKIYDTPCAKPPKEHAASPPAIRRPSSTAPARRMRARISIAWAATLYTLLTGAVPPESVDIMAGIAKPPVAVHLLNPQVPAELSEAIQHAMQLDANKRFPTAGEFKAALYAAIPTMNWGSVPSRAGAAGCGAAATAGRRMHMPMPARPAARRAASRAASQPPISPPPTLPTPQPPRLGFVRHWRLCAPVHPAPGWRRLVFGGCTPIPMRWIFLNRPPPPSPPPRRHLHPHPNRHHHPNRHPHAHQYPHPAAHRDSPPDPAARVQSMTSPIPIQAGTG